MAIIEVRAEDGVCFVSGELDLASADAFERAVERAIDPARELVLDLSDLTFVDSTGLRSIARLASGARRGIVLRHPRPIVMKVLQIVRMQDLPGLRIEGANTS